MALDIARGRRFPIFFDGQRYMGAVEAYVAAAFVRAFGHAPVIIALAPWLAFGLFAALQFFLWSRWGDRATGHLAAAFTIVCAPMPVLWEVVPRGGYIEFLAWSLPTLAAYRALCRSDRPWPLPWIQTVWGFWLAFGYFLNPLSLTIYVTLAIDWTFGRHGADLRRDRHVTSRWLDHRFAPVLGLSLAIGWVLAIAFCCHVEPPEVLNGLPYVGFNGWWSGRSGVAVGALGVLTIIAATAWWTRSAARAFALLMRSPWAFVGLLAGLAPILMYSLLVRLGVYPAALSLPIWIAAPWKAGPNLGILVGSLGTLIGSDPRAAQTVLIGSGIAPPDPRWPMVEAGLIAFSPMVMAVVLFVVIVAALREHAFWARFFALRGDDVAPPVALASAFLAVALGLYLVQGSSPNPASIRYLVPVWVALPGLLAVGLRSLPRQPSKLAGVVLMVPWLTAQSQIWADLDRPSAVRPLAMELTRRGVPAVVAQAQVAVIVANLTHGAIGAVEYQPLWPRLGDRYLGRFATDRPLTCVVDLRFPWKDLGQAWGPEQDLGKHLRGLSQRFPGRVRPTGRVGTFEVWEVALPLSEILAVEPDDVSPGLAVNRH